MKTIWNAGDIITTEKWNNIINNLSFHNARKLELLTNIESNELYININPNTLLDLLKHGIICYCTFEDSLVVGNGTTNTTKFLYIIGYSSYEEIFATNNDSAYFFVRQNSENNFYLLYYEKEYS